MTTFVHHEREKLVNAILYFAHNTKFLGKVKLFKLLYLLDFEHFRQTGRSVTGLIYSAWKFGPVPVLLMQEWEELEPDLAAAISIEPQRIIDYTRQAIQPKTNFDDTHFTKRELRIMTELATKYGDLQSESMIDLTHAENGAWAKVWQEGKGLNQPIAYKLSIDDNLPDREIILEYAMEYAAMRDVAYT